MKRTMYMRMSRDGQDLFVELARGLTCELEPHFKKLVKRISKLKGHEPDSYLPPLSSGCHATWGGRTFDDQADPNIVYEADLTIVIDMGD